MDHSKAVRAGLHAAMTTVPLDSHRYLANLPLDHCYGKTAHGGLLVSIILHAVQQHFRCTLQACKHPHTFNLEAVFLRVATAGKAVVVIKDVKVGANVSTIHFSLIQDDKERVSGYAMYGVSYPKQNILTPEPAPVNFRKLAEDLDPNWVGYTIPWHHLSFLKPITHFRFFSPIKALPDKSITDVWMKFNSSQERFTNEMLGSVADHWHRMLENYKSDSVWNNVQLPVRALQATKEGRQIEGYSTSYAYPTLSMHLEIKKSLPSQGAEWLFLRARSTQIKDGRFDAEIIIMDENLNLVALSHQVCFAIESIQLADKTTAHKEGKL